MRLDRHVSLLLALAAALAAADSTAPTLRGARVRDRVWVRRPGGGRHIELVPSLEELCEREQLDLGAMREVAAGSMEEHEGWSCGTASECESEAAEAASGAAAAAVADGELTPPSPPAGRAASSRRKPKAAASERTAVLSKARGKTAAPAEAAEAAAAGAAVPAGGGGGTMSKMLVQVEHALVHRRSAHRRPSPLSPPGPDATRRGRRAGAVLTAARGAAPSPGHASSAAGGRPPPLGRRPPVGREGTVTPRSKSKPRCGLRTPPQEPTAVRS